MKQLFVGQLDGFVSRAEAGRIIGVDPSAFAPSQRERWWMEHIRYVEIGGHYYYVREDCEEAAKDLRSWRTRAGRRSTKRPRRKGTA